MKKILLAALLAVGSVSAFADKTVEESAAATKNKAVAAGQKVAHRAKEMVCAKGDAACLAQKAKHRAQETGKAISNKGKEAADTIDNDDTVND